MYLGKRLILGREGTGPVGSKVPGVALSTELGSASPKAHVHFLIMHLSPEAQEVPGSRDPLGPQVIVEPCL